jgi:hypothetical protein
MSGLSSIPTNVTISTKRPSVRAVYADKNTSVYDGVYTIGEEVGDCR